jgi:ABC-type nitrate/sulfonate/bicarbonate transport system permease component
MLLSDFSRHALIWLSARGILLFVAVALAERMVMPWADARH